jgi:osmotically inducible protein OsmC
MLVRKSNAVWEGTLKKGRGTVTLGSGTFTGNYSFASRFEDGRRATNPEELVAAAHAACFSMALAHTLEAAGHPATRVATTAAVSLDKVGDGFEIPRIDLETEADVADIDEQEFQSLAEQAKTNCPISKLLRAAKISLIARLLTGQRT